MKKLLALFLIASFSQSQSEAQPDRWQQRVSYVMDIRMDVETNRFTGKQKLAYTNNSPDTLRQVFYHLYWNAFQPNSMMDNRSRVLGQTTVGRYPDWDYRVRDRILKLTPEEIGYQKILSLKMNGIPQSFTEEETILQVKLSKPILPHSTVNFDMEFEAQVPLQVRRSGRDNPQTGVRYSMSQWYPKICEYDYEGWHPTPYVAREFYGVWGDYDVKITIDSRYILGGTGNLENAQQIGYGYETDGMKVNRPPGDKLTWHFTAPNVHDFMWAADARYKHLVRRIAGGPVIHVLYRNKDNAPQADTAWNTLANAAVAVFPFIEKHFGKYPYKQYSFIHGGDGGMEYPMGTLISGPGLGTAFHEWMHTWYQMMLATNESEYAWMDEGFTDWASQLVNAWYRENVTLKMMEENNDEAGIRRLDSLNKLLPLNHAGSFNAYFDLVKSKLEEPLTTHADHFNTNYAYGNAAYSKGCVFLEQLGYITGADVRDKIMLEYYRLWRFKHPNANDFMRVAEKVSGLQLDWYKEYFVNTTKTIDYAIDSLWEQNGKTNVRLRMDGKMPMPIDLLFQFKDGSKEMAYIPQYFMFGAKPVEDASIPRITYDAWKWTSPTYTFSITHRLMDIKKLVIDPSERMADVNRRNNVLELNW